MKDQSSTIRHLVSVVHALRLRGPVATDPTARILHALVLVVAIWYAVWSVILLPMYPDFTPRLLIAVMMEVGPVTALVLLRLGQLRYASIVYLAATCVSATVSMAFRGGIQSTSQVYLVTLPILATWLLGNRAAVWMASVCLGSALVFAILQVTAVNVGHIRPVTPFGAWNTLLLVILIGTVPVGQILRSLQDALAQSRRAEQELQCYKEQLEQLVEQRTAAYVEARDQALAANRAKTVFLANISHELRTPLNAILGYSTLVSEDESLSEQHRKDLAVVGSSGEHLLALIDDVLDMAKIETGGVVVETDTVDLHAVIQDAVKMLRERAHSKNLELRLDIASTTPRFIQTDAAKLRQILTNLLSNGVKYTDDGHVLLRVDAKPGDQPPNMVLVVDVEDTGIGVAPEDQSRIFDAFVQAASTGARKGTGLGLSITREFVRLLGGTIHVESAVGRGSCFHVEIPVGAVESVVVSAETRDVTRVAGVEPGQPDFGILIVEDQKENWLLLERLLSTAGFRVRVAEDGQQAVQIFSEWRPDFIWMDLRLPVMGGVEAARRIRGLEGGEKVKIAAVTASAFASQRDEVLAAGFDDFLRKPYRSRDIFDCMGRHLGVRYVYRLKPQECEEVSTILRPADLAALPSAMQGELKQALISLDRERIGRVVGQVSRQNEKLGNALTSLTDKLAYTPILRALESSSRTFSGATA